MRDNWPRRLLALEQAISTCSSTQAVHQVWYLGTIVKLLQSFNIPHWGLGFFPEFMYVSTIPLKHKQPTYSNRCNSFNILVLNFVNKNISVFQFLSCSKTYFDLLGE